MGCASSYYLQVSPTSLSVSLWYVRVRCKQIHVYTDSPPFPPNGTLNIAQEQCSYSQRLWLQPPSLSQLSASSTIILKVSLTLYFTSDYLRRLPKSTCWDSDPAVLQFYLGIDTSSPTVSMYKSGEIHAGFIFTRNPYITWAVKMCSIY